MEIIGSFIVFVLFIFIYLVIVEVFVMLFRITGMSDEKARFQVISMLTNSGFTTREAEYVVNSKKRRKLAKIVMMFGYAFTVTIVSTVVNIIFQFTDNFTGGAAAFIPVIVVLILVSWFFKKNKWVNSLVDRFIKFITDKYIYGDNFNPIIVVDEHGSLVIARVELKIMPQELVDVELGDSTIKTEHGINVLLKTSQEGEVLPQRNTTFAVGDTIVVMGKEVDIRRVFGLKKLKN